MAYPLHRYRAIANLTDGEEKALRGLGDREVLHHKGEVVRREGDVVEGFHLHVMGWVTSSIVMRNGDRLIQKVHLPGDMLGTPSMVLSRAADTLTAVTDVVTAFVPYERFGRLFVENPRLAALSAVAIQMERLALMDMLATTSNASAKARLARLLLDFHARLTPIGEVRNDSFVMPLTQEAISDLLGLTPVHVNRTIRSFDDNGWISRRDHRIKILDLAALRDLSPINPRVPNFEPDWLPPSN